MDSQFALAGTILQNMQFIGSQAARAGLASVILHTAARRCMITLQTVTKRPHFRPADARVTFYTEYIDTNMSCHPVYYSISFNEGTSDPDDD